MGRKYDQLDLDERAEEVEGELVGGRRGVDGLFQALQRHAVVFEVASPTDEVLKRSAQSVEPPDDEGIAGAEQFLDLVEPWASRDGAADLIDNHLVTAGALERVALQVGILLEG